MEDLVVAHRAAEAHHGVLTRRQAGEAGLSRHEVDHRLATRQWEPTRRGVYRVAGSVRSWEQELAALLAAVGPGAAASHRSAAALLGVPGFARDVLEVTAPRDQRHRRAPGAVVHRSRVLPSDHLTTVEGITTTRVARTLVDLAAVVHPARVERAVENTLASGLMTMESLELVVATLSSRGRKGIRVMRKIVAERSDGQAAPQSQLESRFLQLVRLAGLPDPVRQLDVGDDDRWIGRVDFAYPRARLLIEVDGRRYHSAKSDLDADRGRDNRLVAGGWRVLRFGWPDLVERPDRVVAVVAGALVERPRSGDG